MTIAEHINTHPADRQHLIEAIHNLILKNDPSVEAVVGTMMGKDMILYNDRGSFKYGLANVKEHISFHCLPIYMDPALHAKFTTALPKAKFQKGCANFKSEAEAPLDVLAGLVANCAPTDLIAIRQQQLDAKKKKK
jgi:hypothetical protein